MAMLAEPRRKTRYVLYPGKKPLWNDESTGIAFGKKIMEKMGWNAGKGLGCKEQGIQEPIRVSFKHDNKGMGYKGNDNDWVQHQDEFNSLLSSLSGPTNSTDEEVPVKSLEEKSRSSKARVHYHKFTRGKDLSNYSKKDMACIFGLPKQKKSKIEPEEEVKIPEPEVVEDEEGTKKTSFGIVTIKGGSIQDYFKSKFKASGMKMKTQVFDRYKVDSEEDDAPKYTGFGFSSESINEERQKSRKSVSFNLSLNTTRDISFTTSEESSIINDFVKEKSESLEEEIKEQNNEKEGDCDDHRKSKKKKRKKELDQVMDNSEDVIEPVEHKKKKRKKSNDGDTEDLSADVTVVLNIDDKEEENISEKKKKRKKKNHTKEAEDSVFQRENDNTVVNNFEVNESISDNVTDDVPTSKKKKKKKDKCELTLGEDSEKHHKKVNDSDSLNYSVHEAVLKKKNPLSDEQTIELEQITTSSSGKKESRVKFEVLQNEEISSKKKDKKKKKQLDTIIFEEVISPDSKKSKKRSKKEKQESDQANSFEETHESKKSKKHKKKKNVKELDDTTNEDVLKNEIENTIYYEPVTLKKKKNKEASDEEVLNNEKEKHTQEALVSKKRKKNKEKKENAEIENTVEELKETTEEDATCYEPVTSKKKKNKEGSDDEEILKKAKKKHKREKLNSDKDMLEENTCQINNDKESQAWNENEAKNKGKRDITNNGSNKEENIKNSKHKKLEDSVQRVYSNNTFAENNNYNFKPRAWKPAYLKHKEICENMKLEKFKGSNLKMINGYRTLNQVNSVVTTVPCNTISQEA